MTGFGRISALVDRAGWSQRTLADLIRVDAQVIKRLEKGVGSVATSIAVMNALDFRLTGLGLVLTVAEQLRNCRRKRSLSIAPPRSSASSI